MTKVKSGAQQTPGSACSRRVFGTSSKQEHECPVGKFSPSLGLLPEIETVLLGDAFPPPSPIAQNWTQVAAPGTPGYFRTKHICGSNAKVDRGSNLEWIFKLFWLSRWEPVFWDSSGAVTPLSLLFGAIQSTQQLSLALLKVTMGQVNFLEVERDFRMESFHFQVSTVDVNQVDTGG